MVYYQITGPIIAKKGNSELHISLHMYFSLYPHMLSECVIYIDRNSKCRQNCSCEFSNNFILKY